MRIPLLLAACLVVVMGAPPASGLGFQQAVSGLARAAGFPLDDPSSSTVEVKGEVGASFSRKLLADKVDYGQLWLLYRKLFPAPSSPDSSTPEKIRIIKRLYGCHDDDDDARFCALLNDRLFLALDELDFKIGRDYDLDDD